MKGIVFDLLREMVEENYGLEGWQAILDTAGSEGIYIATQTYPDEELMGLVAAASEVSTVPAGDLVFAFGEFMTPNFYQRYPKFFDDTDNLLEFLKTVDEIIHVEVRKLYPVRDFLHLIIAVTKLIHS